MAAIFVGVVTEALDGPVEGYDDILSEILTEYAEPKPKLFSDRTPSSSSCTPASVE